MEPCLHSCLSPPGFVVLHWMCYWDESTKICFNKLLFCWICVLQTILPQQNFLYILFPGLELNGERSGDFSTLLNHLVTHPSHSSRSILLSFSPAVFHLTPLSPATCHLPVKTFTIKPLSFLASHHFSSCKHFPLPPLVMPSLQLLCQCVWLKCSPGRSKNVWGEFQSFTISFLVLRWRRDLRFLFFSSSFLSWCFLAPVTMFLSGCFWIKTWQFSLLNYIKSVLGFLVN